MLHCILEMVQLSFWLSSWLISVRSLWWGVGERLRGLHVHTNQTMCWWKHWEPMQWDLELCSFSWISSFHLLHNQAARWESHEEYLSKKLLLNVTIVLRNVLYLSILLLAHCSCSSVLFVLGPMWQQELPSPLCAWAWECEGRESTRMTPNRGCWREFPELRLSGYVQYK